MDGVTSTQDDLYETANLYPRTTGLPMTVWVSPCGGARNDARVKVSVVCGERMVPEGAAVVGIRPEPRLIEGELGRAEFLAFARWIVLKRDALIAFWEGEIVTIELGQKLVRV